MSTPQDECDGGKIDVEFACKELYELYHKQWWCRKQMFYHFKLLNSILNGIALIVIAAGVVVGSIWDDSVVVIVLSTFASLVKGWNDFKKYAIKKDMCQYACSAFNKAMIEIEGFEFNGIDQLQFNSFVTKMITMEATISDFTPPISDKLYAKYKSVGKTYKRVTSTLV